MENLIPLFEDQEFFEAILQHRTHLKDPKSSGPTSAFWFSFLEMMNTLFIFNRSLKIGNWELHLHATRLMLPWFFAYDRSNYSRFLTFYWAEMTNLPKTHPEIHNQFI